MTATVYAAKGLPVKTQMKYNAAKARLAKRDRIRTIRDGLAEIIATSEREWTRRRSEGLGNEPPKLLTDVISIESDFELLLLELGQK